MGTTAARKCCRARQRHSALGMDAAQLTWLRMRRDQGSARIVLRKISGATLQGQKARVKIVLVRECLPDNRRLGSWIEWCWYRSG